MNESPIDEQLALPSFDSPRLAISLSLIGYFSEAKQTVFFLDWTDSSLLAWKSSHSSVVSAALLPPSFVVG